MTTQTAEIADKYEPTTENFAELLDEYVGDNADFEGRLIKGTVLSIDNDAALIDVGLKVEGRVPLKEFAPPGQTVELKIGDQVEVFIERIENRRGEAVLSRERARREEAWEKLEKAHQDGQRVDGVIFGRVKGGFTVDLDGAIAFLPGSQVDIRPVRDMAPLLGTTQPFQILKMDRRRGNIVVSRRAVLEDTRAEQRNELIANMSEGQVLDGIVKNITDYGAFIDLGGVDGLLHVTDIAWRRVNHPTDALQIGRVTNITDYGAFVELEPGVEGLVHVSEMSWTKKNVHPGKIVSTSQEVEVMVLDVDTDKRRISLGIKQCLSNPWASFETNNPEGTVLDGEIKNITEFGLFVELSSEIFGMVHLSDIDWSLSGEAAVQKYTKGDKVKVKVLSIDTEKERIGLGIKQLDQDPFQIANEKRGQAVTCTVKGLNDQGVEVEALNGLPGFVRRSDLARDRNEQRPDRFAVGDKFDAKLVQIDRTGRRLTLSIKALEVEEEKQAVEEYGSTDSGASLGDILGAAISRKQEAEALGEDQQEDDVVASADKDEIVDSKASQEIITDAVSSKEEEKK